MTYYYEVYEDITNEDTDVEETIAFCLHLKTAEKIITGTSYLIRKIKQANTWEWKVIE